MRPMQIDRTGAEPPSVLLTDGHCVDGGGAPVNCGAASISRRRLGLPRVLVAAEHAAVRYGAGLYVDVPIARPTTHCRSWGWSSATMELRPVTQCPTNRSCPPICLDTVTRRHDAVSIPLGSTKTDLELESSGAIGPRARYLRDEADSAARIASHVLRTDVNERDSLFECAAQ